MSIFNTNGISVNGMSISEAMGHSNLNWTVSKRPIFVLSERTQDWHGTSKFFATTRDDNDNILGIVGPDYQIIQNHELAYLAERVSGSDVKVETCGSIQGGQRVWIQLNANPFDVGEKKDTVQPKFLLTNGHTGLHPLAALPTTVRVICENTLNMALNTGRKNNMMITLKHTGSIQNRLESLVDAIEEFKNRTQTFQSKAESLARKSVSTEFVQAFWTQVYMNMFGDIHGNPTTEAQLEANKQATSTMVKWSNTFDSEVKHSGANLWTAMNAVTYWLDHQQIYRGTNKNENRFVDILFGNGAKEKVAVMDHALSMA